MKNKELHPRTMTINHKQQLACRQLRLKALGWLVERFPKAFDTSVEIFPLSIGIMEDILQYAEEAQVQGISKSKLREALVLYTRRLDYLACLKAQGQRVNLFGEPAGMVTEEEAQLAALKIKKRIEKSIRTQKKVTSQENFGSRNAINTYSSYDNLAETREHTPRQPEIVFKKAVRATDALSVERLKSKLGLIRKEEA